MDENPIQAKRDALPRRRIVRPAFLSAAAAALTGAVVMAGCGDNSNKAKSDTETTATRTKAVAVTAEDLRTIAVRMRQPIYWVGPART